MSVTKSVTVLFSMFIYLSHCQRKINDGLVPQKDRGYVVYLVKAPLSARGYDAWLCGGAIVTSQFVITSAACVTDVDYVYVIAGYKKYVPDNQIETDKCTSAMKKKVIYTCFPQDYVLNYGELDHWADLDIALVKVESPFDFDDPRYETLCSYKPSTIPINYEEKYQEAGEDALVFGWGHEEIWRRPGDIQNYNQPILKYTSALLMDKKDCLDHYKDYRNMTKTINKYMICSLGNGNIDDEGKIIQNSLPLTGCTTGQQKLLGFEGVSCEDGDESSSDDDDTRRSDKRSNQTNNVNLTDLMNNTQARRHGICQNDHGGPLITWAGASEILIGVASVFKVSEDYECMGPYLYTSTYCTGVFLNCILASEFPDGRRNLCDRPAGERGYVTIERTISWKDHPAGPAENENIGRTGSEPKLSPGLKYLIKNNQPMSPDNKKFNKFQAHKISPIVNNEPKKRFSVEERGSESVSVKRNPVNDGHQEKPELNKMYIANNSPLHINKNPPSMTDPGVPSYPVNQRQPEIQKYPVIGRYPARNGPPKYFQNAPASMALRSIHPIRN